MRANTPGSKLNSLSYSEECYIKVDDVEIEMKILPEISDGKSVNYANENAIGRTSPYSIFANGELRSIGWTCHFIIEKEGDAEENLQDLRRLQSACYPTTQEGHPPPICHLKCGQILSKDELCAVLKSYSIKYDTNVPWHQETMLPYKFSVDLQFDVVYNLSDIPISSDILDDF